MTVASPTRRVSDSTRDGTVLTLVDFNNIDPRARDSDAPIVDALELVGILVRHTLLAPNPVRSRSAQDVELRLYDGWIDRQGAGMDKLRRTSRLYPAVLSGLKDGVRIRAQVVTSLACAPAFVLVGTYINGGQKMVDQMLAQDLHYFASLEAYDRICIVANDEDYVPVALAAASRYQTPIHWLRSRSAGRNDAHLTSLKITTLYNERWNR